MPIGAGLVGTLLPSFGFLPAIGGDAFSLDPWRALLAAPGFATSLRLTLVTGLCATVLSTLLAVGIVAYIHHRAWGLRLGGWLAPLLAMPHSALAIGFAFLIAPSGWLVRLVTPGLTGWEVPPDVSTVGHPSGWALVAALLLKEVPYLMLMTFGALAQVPARAHLPSPVRLGYAPVPAYLKTVLPLVYPQIRLPVYAVLAFSLSVVDVAMIVGPANPPTLAVLAVRWFADPDVRLYFQAAAAATLLLALVALSIAALAWARTPARGVGPALDLAWRAPRPVDARRRGDDHRRCRAVRAGRRGDARPRRLVVRDAVALSRCAAAGNGPRPIGNASSTRCCVRRRSHCSSASRRRRSRSR